MKRKITERLIEWKNRPNHKPLILQGARQVGKSYILEEFGRNHYKNYVSVSLDLVTDLQNFLKENINPLEIIAYLESLFNTRILPHETLVILDEIQDCKRALLALKYFQEEYPQYDIVAAGIDVYDPANQNVYSATVRVTYGSTAPFNISYVRNDNKILDYYSTFLHFFMIFFILKRNSIQKADFHCLDICHARHTKE